jgi:1-acyl-sn-glycerol-3-phosphate acyltransferases
MKRILLMLLRNILFAPIWFIRICIYGKSDKYTEEQRYGLLKRLTIKANKSGRVKIESYGLENIPKENGFIIFPNHQGLYDVLGFIESCPNPFSVVTKKEVKDVPFLKQIFTVLKAKVIDREDIRQSMLIIKEMAEDVKEGRNYLIFAEGTRSKEENKVQDFKGGSFKSAVIAKCPILPAAIIDAYKPFDRNSIKKVTVQIHYLEPIYYEEYKDLKTTEIARIVKEKIQITINEFNK